MALTAQAGGMIGRVLSGGAPSEEAYAKGCIAPMPTLARGVDQVGEINGRLSEMHSRLSSLADVIGGPRPVGGMSGGAIKETPSGIVDRLNEGVSAAHSRIDEINELITTIGRQLG